MIKLFLRDLQKNFESLYRLDPAPDITHFIVEQKTTSRELLLIKEEEDLFLGLVLDPQIFTNLGGDLLSRHNLADFSLAVEGVSHFIFVVFCARQERCVAPVELELQGEVDKFIAGAMLANRCYSLPIEALHRQLFYDFTLLEGLDAAVRRRYQHANTLARRYTQTLDQRFIRHQRSIALRRELRRFYRMNYHRKQELIAKAA